MNFQPLRCALTAISMSSTVVLSSHPPDSSKALILQTPAVPLKPKKLRKTPFTCCSTSKWKQRFMFCNLVRRFSSLFMNDHLACEESVGAEVDDGKIDLLFSLIKDHDVTELIAAGREKMSALSSGGPAVAVVAGSGGDAPAAEPAAESGNSKKVEEEEKEDSDDGGMMSLFD